ncbi:MAG: DUF3460 family protein [Burkholderiales bacterium]|nr:DUF3460 family protein [Burkholderiales bacterium]
MLPSRLFLSDTDAFLRDYRRAHPETLDKQKEGLRLWWGSMSGIKKRGARRSSPVAADKTK